jgi:hypothetical protein
VIHVGIQDSIGRYQCVGLKRANEIIGTTTEELVLKARQGNLTTWWCLQNLLSNLMYMLLLLVNHDNPEISGWIFSSKNARLMMTCPLDGICYFSDIVFCIFSFFFWYSVFFIFVNVFSTTLLFFQFFLC